MARFVGFGTQGLRASGDAWCGLDFLGSGFRGFRVTLVFLMHWQLGYLLYPSQTQPQSSSCQPGLVKASIASTCAIVKKTAVGSPYGLSGVGFVRRALQCWSLL